MRFELGSLSKLRLSLPRFCLPEFWCRSRRHFEAEQGRLQKGGVVQELSPVNDVEIDRKDEPENLLSMHSKTHQGEHRMVRG